MAQQKSKRDLIWEEKRRKFLEKQQQENSNEDSGNIVYSTLSYMSKPQEIIIPDEQYNRGEIESNSIFSSAFSRNNKNSEETYSNPDTTVSVGRKSSNFYSDDEKKSYSPEKNIDYSISSNSNSNIISSSSISEAEDKNKLKQIQQQQYFLELENQIKESKKRKEEIKRNENSKNSVADDHNNDNYYNDNEKNINFNNVNNRELEMNVNISSSDENYKKIKKIKNEKYLDDLRKQIDDEKERKSLFFVLFYLYCIF
jgi:hypothetical protein